MRFSDRGGLQIKLAEKVHEIMTASPELWDSERGEHPDSPWMKSAEEILTVFESHQGAIQRHAETAVRSVIKRIQTDPRVAWLVGPCSQTYEDVTTAYAHMVGCDPGEFKKAFLSNLETEAWPGQDDTQPVGGDGF